MDISIVIPVYQAELSIAKVVDSLQLHPYLKTLEWELILVDDHSTDKSYQIIQEKALQYKNIRGISFHKNSGQHVATYVGIKEAKGNYLFTMDDDGEHPIDQMEAMVNLLEKEQADIVYASPAKRDKSRFRKFLSGAIKLSGRLSGGFGDGSAYRLIHHSVYRQLQDLSIAFVFIDEILAWYTKNVRFLPVTFPSSLKRTTYVNTKLFGLYYDIVYAYSSFPAQLLTKLGFTGSIISLLIGCYYIFKKLFFKTQLGFTSIAVSILFSASIILFGLGVLAQYAYRQSRILNQLPQYSIKYRTDN